MDSIYKYPKINGKTNYDVSFERDRLGVGLVVSLNCMTGMPSVCGESPRRA